jgi:hypothetical protein
MGAAVVAYYLARKVMSPGAPGGYTVRGEAIPYLVLGLLAGAGMAVLGAFWTSGGTRWKGVAAGVLAGALGAEVIVLMSRSWRGPELMFAVLEGGAAVAAAWILPRSLRGRVPALIVGGGRPRWSEARSSRWNVRFAFSADVGRQDHDRGPRLTR